MAMKRINKRKNYRLEDEGQLRLSFSTEDRFNPDVVCMSGDVWLKYQGEGDCEKVINKVRFMAKRGIHEWLEGNPCFSDRMIFDFSIVANNMLNGIKKKLSVEVLLRRRDDVPLEKMRDYANAGLRPIFKELLRELERGDFVQQSGKKG